MSATKRRATKRRDMHLDLQRLVETNKRVDIAQVLEAQRLLLDLRREGVGGPSYGIESPYVRRSVRDRPTEQISK